MKECVSAVFWPNAGAGNTVPRIGEKLVIIGTNDCRLRSSVVIRADIVSPVTYGMDVTFYVTTIDGWLWRHIVKLKSAEDVDYANSMVLPPLLRGPARPVESGNRTIARSEWQGIQFNRWLSRGVEDNNTSLAEWNERFPFVWEHD